MIPFRNALYKAAKEEFGKIRRKILSIRRLLSFSRTINSVNSIDTIV